MSVYVVILHTRDLDHDSGSLDEYRDIVKIFSSPNKANDFLEGKPTTQQSIGRWFSVAAYEVLD
jgi:hypothetical protein